MYFIMNMWLIKYVNVFLLLAAQHISPVTDVHMSLTLMANTSADSAGVDVLIYDQCYCDNQRYINTAD